jgi:Ca2+-binding EF-hand superfamily protein
MVPIYAINALSCFRRAHGMYVLPEIIQLVREFYEAIAIVGFVQLLLYWLGGPRIVSDAFRRELQEPQHVWITCFPQASAYCTLLRKVPMPFLPGPHLIAGLLKGVLQFAAMALCFCFVNFIFWVGFLMSLCTHKVMHHAETAMLLLKGASMGVAMYCIILLLTELERNAVLHARLEQLHPHLKFWSIKLIVFLPVLQKCVVEKLLPLIGMLDQIAHEAGDGWTSWEVGVALQNFILCLETMLFAVFMFFAYPLRELSNQDNTGDGDFELMTFQLIRQIMAIDRHARKVKRNIHQIWSSRSNTDSDIEECFQYFANDNGTISTQVFAYTLTMAGFAKDEALAGASRVDVRGTGEITFEQFEEVFRRTSPTFQIPTSPGQVTLVEPRMHSMG